MKKRILSILLAALMIVSLLPISAFAKLADAELFDFSEGKINAYNGDDVVNLEIPAEINDSSVTAIGERAFNEHDEISILIIPEGVAEIEDSAFSGCTALTTVVIPSTVTTIGENVLSGCENLTDIYLNWTESIPEGINFETLSLPPVDGPTIHIPEGLDQSNPQLYIGYQAAFGNELAEGSLVLPEFEIDEDGVITGYNGNGGSVTIPAKIGDTDVTAIGEKVFESCQTLTGVTIPAGVTSIGEEAFCNCQYLTTVTFTEDSKLESIGKSAFNSCLALTGITIPASVTSIGDSAFNSCKELAAITFAAGSQLETIDGLAFGQCSALENIEIPDSVTTIGNRAFLTSGLKSIALPEKLGSIGVEVFQYCSALESVTIPASVKSIGDNAFQKCSTLADVTVSWTGDAVIAPGGDAFDQIAAGAKLLVPKGTMEAYTNATNEAQQNWTKWFTIEEYVPAAIITSWATLQDAIDAAPGDATTSATETTTIKLTQDLTAPEQDGASITILEGKDITLDLNGKVLNANGGAFGVITVEEGGKLTLIDSKPTTEHYFNVDATTGLWTLTNTSTDKTKTVKGGVITGGTGKDCGTESGKDLGTNGGGVYVDKGTFNMNGGNIVGNKATLSEDGDANGMGGGVNVFDGTFTMSGGTITGNDASGGGGVNVLDGTFTMSGGTITGNDATGGGGVYNYATFTMTGGTISGNEAQFGGGVYNNGTFTMSGGTITGNTAGLDGGGVCNDSSEFNMFGGEITENTAGRTGGGIDVYGPVTVGGTAVIKNNFGHTDTTAVASDAEIEGSSTITISSVHTTASGMEIGVLGKKGNKILGATSGDTAYFFSNNGGLKFGFVDDSNGYLELQEISSGEKVKYIGADGKEAEATATKLTSDSKEWSGTVYITENTTIDDTVTLTDDTILILADGATLTVKKGITGGKNLTVYGQTAGTGKLVVTGIDGTNGSYGANGGDGITANVTVYSGEVQVTGGNAGYRQNEGGTAAGGYGVSGTVTVSGNGKATVTGGNGCDTSNDEPGMGGTGCLNLTVSGSGEATVTGGNGGVGGNNSSVGGYGVTSGVSVSENGTAIIKGGNGGNGGGFGTSGNITVTDQGSATISGGNATVSGKTGANAYYTYNRTIDGKVTGTNEPNDQTGGSVTITAIQTPWSALQDAINKATEPTNIQLTDDLTAPEQDGTSITIPEGKDITLDLNGKVLNTNGGAFSVIKVANGGKLTLIDSAPTTEHKGYVDADGLWHLGEIPQAAEGCTEKTVLGGIITGGNSVDGGGVYVGVKGSFSMSGGNITGNTATKNGGGVCVPTYGDFTMSGNSKITYNIAKQSGGGVYIGTSSFTMTGGEITGNNVVKGYPQNNPILFGGGVLFGGATLTLGGTAKITGNTMGSTTKTADNLCLPNNKTVTLGTGTGGGGNGVAAPVTGENGMKIGVTTQTAPAEGTPVQITTNGAEAQKACFTPDNSGYEVAFDTDHLELAKVPAGVAQIGDKSYTTLADAIKAAQAGDTIKLTENIAITEQLEINKAITFDGNGKTITRTPNDGAASTRAGILVSAGATIKNLTVSGPNTTASGWDSGEFGIKLFNANGATLDGVTVKNANAGIQVNGGSVTMKNNITVSDNEYGGIELCHGGALDLSAATLVCTDEADAKPVLWNDDTKGTITFSTSQLLSKKIADANKDHYYLSSDKQMVSLNGQNYLTLADAVAEAQNNSIITLLQNNSETITVNKIIAFQINANGKTFTPANISAGTGFERIMSTESGVTTYKFGIPVTFDTEAKPVNGGNAITYGTTYTVTAPTVSDTNGALNPQPAMTYTYYESDGNGGWTILNPNEQPANAGSYKVVIAVKDDNATYTGSKEYTFSIAKANVTAPALADSVTINYANEKITSKEGYEVSTTSGASFDTGKLTGETAIDFTKTYYIRKAADDNHNASAETEYKPTRPATPTSAPELDSKTDTTVTVTAVDGQEYSKDNGTTWVSGTEGKVTFTGLTANSAYSIITRVKAVTTEGSEKFASANSTASVITTKSSDQPQGSAEPVDVVGGKIISGGTAVEIKDSDGEALSNEELAKVAEAINEVLDNDKVKNFGKTTDETGIEKATEASNSDIADALKDQTTDTVAKGNVNETDISKYLNVTLVSADVDVDTTVTITSMVFDVTPMATITVPGSNGPVTLTTEITNDEIDGTMTFLLPVDKSIEAETAAVYHEGTFFGNFEIRTDGSVNKYIEVITDSFSEFGYITLDETTAGAKIGDTLYASLSDAVSAVQNNETITLLKDASGTITVSRVVKFTVDANGKNNTAEIVAGSGYTVSKSGSTYTVSAYSGGGGGTSSYAVELPANVKNGKVEVSPKNASAGQTVTLTVTPDKGFTLETLTVLDKNGKKVEINDLGNGKYSFKMPNSKVTISATFVKAGTCPQDSTCVYAKFNDADTKAWYHDGVHFCVENGYMQGVSATAFDPSGTTTRAMIVTMLWRMEGEPVVNYAMSFKDVKGGQWYTEAIRWAQSNGIVEGYSIDAFGSDDPITREQMATILYRYAKNRGIDVMNTNTLAGFTDVNKVSAWALDAMKWANAVGLVQGRTTTTLVPEVSITRAEAATMVQRYCEAFKK